MQTITLKVQDHAVEKLQNFLQSLSGDIEVVESQKSLNENDDMKLKSMEELYGILSPYVNGRLSDEDIEQAIVEAAVERGMSGKNHG